MKLPFLMLILILLTGCSAAMVPYSSDPEIKLSQSFHLIKQGRWWAAKNIANEALEIFKKNNDLSGQGDAYYILALLYDTQYRYSKNSKEETKDQLLKTEFDYLEKSIAKFISSGNNGKAALPTYHMGLVYKDLNNKTKACPLFNKALELYKSDKINTVYANPDLHKNKKLSVEDQINEDIKLFCV